MAGNNIGRAKIAFMLLGLLGTCYVIVIFAFPSSVKLIESNAAATVGVIAGLLIGSTGIFLGSTGNLFALIRNNSSNNTTDNGKLRELVSQVSNSISEIKQNVIFIIVVFLAVLLFPLVEAMNIPLIHWPTSIVWLSKSIIISTISLWFTILAFIAVIDSVKAMFILHRHYEIAIIQLLDQSNRGGSV